MSLDKAIEVSVFIAASAPERTGFYAIVSPPTFLCKYLRILRPEQALEITKFNPAIFRRKIKPRKVN